MDCSPCHSICDSDTSSLGKPFSCRERYNGNILHGLGCIDISYAHQTHRQDVNLESI